MLFINLLYNEFDVSDYYNLGEMLIDVDYVKKRCEEDLLLSNSHGNGEDDGNERDDFSKQAVIAKSGNGHTEDHTEDDVEYEYEYVEVDEYDDRGVAFAMHKIYDPEIRIHMLIVHGMLHLVGYDHIEDDEYEIMVTKEDKVLAELRRRLGNDFGVTKSLPAGDMDHQHLG